MAPLRVGVFGVGSLIHIVDHLRRGQGSVTEALYWAGAARYKGTQDAAALTETAQAFRERYQDTPWATRASVWGQG